MTSETGGINPALLLQADGIAIIGASERGHYPRSIFQNLVQMGFPAHRIYPVNAKYSSVYGLPAYPSIGAVPEPVSLAVLATNRNTVPELLQAVADRGIRSAVVLADGFAEQGPEGHALQEQVTAIARDAGLTMLGPNTLGCIVPETGLGVWAGGVLPGSIRPGGVALVFQSSGMLNLALSLICHRQTGLRAAISVGNEAVTDAASWIEHFAADPAVRVIGVVMESTLAPGRLAQALHLASEHNKPVVMLKLGRSERAQQNALAHTGRMASSGLAWEALLHRLDVILTGDLDELMETLVLLSHRRPLPVRGGLGLFTISGGDCSLLSDIAEGLDLPLPDVTTETRQQLVAALDKPTLVGNPLDLENLRREDPRRYAAAIDAFVADPQLGLVGFRMNLSYTPNEALLSMYEDLIARAAAHGRTPVALTRAVEPLDTAWFQFFESKGVPFLQTYRTGLTAIRNLFRYDRRHRTDGPPAGVPMSLLPADPRGRILDWETTQSMLRRAGLPYAPSVLARSPREAGRLAAEVGFPVAVKLISPALPHKSDVGGVRLGLQTAGAVKAACRDMLAQAEAVGSGHGNRRLPMEGFEVQAMVPGGTELILGMTTDPAVGPVILVGMGGVLAEVMHDAVLAVPPIHTHHALALLDRLKGAPLLHGVRGKPPMDRAALAEIITRFSAWVVEQKDHLLQVDLNPVMVLPQGQGAVAVDALVVTREEA